MGEKLTMTCPLCGRLAFVEQFEKEHKFPRVVLKKFKGQKIEHEEINDPYIVNMLVDVIVQKCVKILEQAGYEVKLVKKDGS